MSQKNDFSHAGFPITVKEILDSYRKLLKIKDKQELLSKIEEWTEKIPDTTADGKARLNVDRRHEPSRFITYFWRGYLGGS